ncbi:GAF domain-containing protein, partial [Frankia sp. CNm7]|nr:GAF domain-containing protein [Frankia nepalensis]
MVKSVGERRDTFSATASVVGLERARERFFTADVVEPGGVRDLIWRSWTRARGFAVPVDRPDPVQVEVNWGVPLERVARPVLRHMAEQFQECAVVAALVDPDGIVLAHFGGDPVFTRQMAEEGPIVRGFDFSEVVVGTNGIGTALAVGRPVMISAGEHYSESGGAVSCAGAPLRDPVTGEVAGLVNFTCPAKDASPLLLAMATSTAAQIERELLTAAGPGDLEVLAGGGGPAALRTLVAAERRRRVLAERLGRVTMRAAQTTDVRLILARAMSVAEKVFPIDALWVLRWPAGAPARVIATYGDVEPRAVGTEVPADVAGLVLRAANGERVAGRAAGLPGRSRP